MCLGKSVYLDLSFVCVPKKMAHISTAWLCFLFLKVVIPAAMAQDSTQADIDNIAANLEIKVYPDTNHLSTGTYNIAYKLTNKGSVKILHTNDWEIIFSMHSRDLLTKPEFKVSGFVIKPYKENLYKMTSLPGVFPGLRPGQAFKITIKAKGLSVFKTDIHPKFVVTSPNTIPRTIRSTNDDTLGFVELAPTSNDAFSKMSGVQRTMMVPKVMDYGKVPPTIVSPTPLNITMGEDVNLLNLNTVPRFFVWADSSVSQTFKRYFQTTFSTLLNSPRLEFVNSQPSANSDKIYIQQTGPDPKKSADYYEMAVRPKTATRNFNLIHMSATSEAGLHNAMESLMSAFGLYDALPEMTIKDDARFGHRSLSLDLTKTFFPRAVIEKVLKLMSMYKLNKLELNLGDNYAWRLQVNDMLELTNYASKRCLSNENTTCLPPFYGDGTDVPPPLNRFFTVEEFAKVLAYAKTLHIEVIPRFNFLGGMLAAKRASQIRYDNLYTTDRTRAQQMYLVSQLPTISAQKIPEDELSIEGLLDPCIKQTFTFINTVISQTNRAYSMASVPFKAIHAGGDELTQFLGNFPSCKKAGIKSTAEALSTMIGTMQKTLSTVNAVLHVNEEAIIDPTTNDCLTIPPASKMSKNGLVVHFHRTSPGSPEDWGLTKEQFAYMDGEVVPPPSPENPNGTFDELLQYKGQKKGLTSWILPYRCANKDYKIVLKPENFFSLDSAYELDFDEPGFRKKRSFHIISMLRMMMYEPFNHYINMDLGKDGYTFLQYRMCNMFPCETLTKPQNVLGLTATLDTGIIRTEALLWKMLLPRLICFASKAWRVGEHENILKAEDPTTLINDERLAHRSGAITMEIEHLMNVIAYKDGGRLDVSGYAYRVPTVGTSIRFGLAFMTPPPYPLDVQTDIPSLVEYRDLTARGSTWQPLFSVDPATGMMRGYMFEFPASSQRIEVRAVSAGGSDGAGKRPGRSTIVTGSIENYLPREIPIELRQGTCLPTEQAWTTDVANVTDRQWRRVLQNIEPVMIDNENFRIQRFRSLEDTVAQFNRLNNRNYTLPWVFNEIEILMSNGTNFTELAPTNISRLVFLKDQAIFDERRRAIETRYGNWQQEYLKCQAGQAQVTLLPNRPLGRLPGAGVGGGLAGAGAGVGRAGGAMGMGGQGSQAGGIGSAVGSAAGSRAGAGTRGSQSRMDSQGRAQSGRDQRGGQSSGMRGGARSRTGGI